MPASSVQSRVYIRPNTTTGSLTPTEAPTPTASFRQQLHRTRL
ncbi:hypothetical protein O7627_27385 [Solwaraspora sp. WMMD1047]|nr:hypothetical protein [Solwaraspora sp. WMMD1047]MDG4833000.1 hypothetical protein [Solwaraspora sp. WMMD1047]